MRSPSSRSATPRKRRETSWADSQSLTDACRPISLHPPAVVSCRPFLGAAFGRCYTNVEMMVSAVGGCLVSGWAIWEDRGMTLNCEHHAVWRMPDGEVRCVTPQLNGEREIVFVLQRHWGSVPNEDALLPYVRAYFLPLSDHPRIRAICDLLSQSALCVQGSARHTDLRERAITLRDRHLQKCNDRVRLRERRRRGHKG